MSKYRVGDKVLIKDYMDSNGSMIEDMVERFGGKVCTISKVERVTEFDGSFFDAYEIAENDDSSGFKYTFVDEDIVCLVHSSHRQPQRIEIPIPGGHLVAETFDRGGPRPGILLSFIKSGEVLERDLCFAEVCVEEDPDVIRVGTLYEDGRDVKEIFEYPMTTKED